MKLLQRAKIFTAAIAVSGFVLVLSGCGGVSAEQIEQLNTLKNQVSALENKVSSLNEEKSRLEKQIAERNKKLEECAKLRQETEKNLSKLPK